MVSKVGQEIGGEKFWAVNFKKRDGFKRAHQLARQWGLYRQNYCVYTAKISPFIATSQKVAPSLGNNERRVFGVLF